LGKDGREYIIEVTGSQMTLLGESQEDDRRCIADLVVQKMSSFTRPSIVGRQTSRTSLTSTSSGFTAPVQPPSDDQSTTIPPAQVGGPPIPSRVPPGSSIPRRGSRETNPFAQPPPLPPTGPPPGPQGGGAPPIPSRVAPPMQPQQQPFTESPQMTPSTSMTRSPFRKQSESSETVASTATEGPDDPVKEDDTMKNLRKTFAGIFGDM